jgi:hypothetical protein
MKSRNQPLTNFSIPANKFNQATYLRIFSNTLPSRVIDHLLKSPLKEAVLVVVVSQIINKTFPPHLLRYDKGLGERELEPLKVVVLCLQKSTNAVIGRFCGCVPGPYEDALGEGLFAIAVRWKASKVVEGVLNTAKHGRNIIDSFKTHENTPSALEVALRNRDVQSVMSIVAYFGEFEPPSKKELLSEFGHNPWPTKLAMDLCNGFHANGLPIPVSAVKAVFESGDFTSIRSLVRNASNPKEITYALWMAKPEVSNAIIEKLGIDHQACLFDMILPYLGRIDFDHRKRERIIPHLSTEAIESVQRNLSRRMTHAATSHQTKLTQIFRLHGIRPSAIDLCEAVCTQNTAAIKALIEAGADVTGNTYACSHTLQAYGVLLGSNLIRTTPYAEAIRSKSASINEIFQSHVLHPHFAPLDYNLSIIIAASEVGNVRLLDEYLPSVPKDSYHGGLYDRSALDDALSLALVGNHEEL